ncbi:MAG: hypothetical protein JSW03_06815 [Candidatus Eiseniibacteriota bacterium]|nr:MAG: hypothetical protein JSW03_06815 [Candidatus Eisenbacteria bacterium]
MKRIGLLTAIAVIVALGFTIALSKGMEGTEKTGVPAAASSKLPSSLDNLFPPKAEMPIFYLKMLEMNTAFSGMVADLFEGDIENVKADFQAFKALYAENSTLVPEWEAYYPAAPVEELGIALATGDPGKVMPAVEKAGATCHNCHMANMARVQLKYHWGNFSSLMIDDPLTQEEVDFRRFKQFLAANYAGIIVDVAQGQQENAQKQLQGFAARFDAMRASCDACHTAERKYYVDEGMQSVIDELGKALGKSPLDGKHVGELIQNIGMNSCSPCHRVHAPAAFANF